MAHLHDFINLHLEFERRVRNITNDVDELNTDHWLKMAKCKSQFKNIVKWYSDNVELLFTNIQSRVVNEKNNDCHYYLYCTVPFILNENYEIYTPVNKQGMCTKQGMYSVRSRTLVTQVDNGERRKTFNSIRTLNENSLRKGMGFNGFGGSKETTDDDLLWDNIIVFCLSSPSYSTIANIEGNLNTFRNKERLQSFMATRCKLNGSTEYSDIRHMPTMLHKMCELTKDVDDLYFIPHSIHDNSFS